MGEAKHHSGKAHSLNLFFCRASSCLVSDPVESQGISLGYPYPHLHECTSNVGIRSAMVLSLANGLTRPTRLAASSSQHSDALQHDGVDKTLFQLPPQVLALLRLLEVVL